MAALSIIFRYEIRYFLSSVLFRLLTQTDFTSPEAESTSRCQNSGGESSKDQGMGDAEVVRGECSRLWYLLVLLLKPIYVHPKDET